MDLRIDKAKRISEDFEKMGGKLYLVGGFVRDLMYGISCKDIDVEIHGLSIDKVEEILSSHGELDRIGKSFGVYKIHGLDIDFSLPRKEKSTGTKHRDFSVIVDPFLGIEKALRRRDFTINAMAIEINSGELIDPFNGENDLQNRTLRIVDEKTFIEDPLRVLRGAQFSARMELTATAKTLDTCKSIKESYRFISPERVWEELKKLLLKGISPSLGIKFLKETEWLSNWPELDVLFNTPQDKIHHPEGNVGIHTLQVIDNAAQIRDSLDEKDRLVFMLAVLLHDVGKAVTTVHQENNRISSHGHDKEGVTIAQSFLRRLTNETSLIERACALVENHMFPHYCKEAKAPAFRRLFKRVDPFLLEKVAMADNLHKDAREYYSLMINKVKSAAPEKKKTIVQGRHLISRGFTPGPIFSEIISACEEYYLETGITNPDEILDEILNRSY